MMWHLQSAKEMAKKKKKEKKTKNTGATVSIFKKIAKICSNMCYIDESWCWKDAGLFQNRAGQAKQISMCSLHFLVWELFVIIVEESSIIYFYTKLYWLLWTKTRLFIV